MIDIAKNVVKNLPTEQNSGKSIENFYKTATEMACKKGNEAHEKESYSKTKDTKTIDMSDSVYVRPEGRNNEESVADQLMDESGIDMETRQRQMVVLSNTTSAEDYKKIQEDGFSFSETDGQTIITETDKIKAVLAKAGVDISIYGDELDEAQLEEITGDAAVASMIMQKMQEKDIPLTDENVNDMVAAIAQIGDIEKLNEQTMAYILKNNQLPTVENFYKAQHSGASEKAIITDLEFESLKPQMTEIIAEAGMQTNDKNYENCRWLIENNIPVTGANLEYLEKLQVFSKQEEIDTEVIVNAVVDAIAEGKRPNQAMLLDGYSTIDRAQNAVIAVNEVTDENIAYLVENNKELNIKNIQMAEKNNLSTVVNDTNPQYIRAKRQLEEIRLAMTAEANYALLKKGISIDTKPLEELVENLKEQENAYYKNLLDSNGVISSDENIDTFKSVNELVGQLKYAPAYALDLASDNSTLGEVAAKAETVKADFENANRSYETMMTTPRSDLGDSIIKAFANVNDILLDLGMEQSESNQRAVRILAYNEIAINQENIEKIKAVDEEIQRAFSNLTPKTTLEMIRQGIQPLEMTISELNAVAADIKQSTEDNTNEKFSKYLWKLEQNKEITEEERTSYIGIYRLIAQVEKTDGAVIGALINQGADITMKNLLTAVRNQKKAGMEYTIDDDFDGVDAKNDGTNIDAQIRAAYEANLVSDIMDNITPSALKEIGAEWENMTPEQFKDALTNKEYDTENEVALENEYVNEQLSDFQQVLDADENVYAYLDRYDIKNSIINIMSVSQMLRHPNKVMERLWKEDGLSADSLDKIAWMKEEILERFGEAVKTPEEMADAQEALAEVATRVMKTMINENETISALDLKELRLMNNQFSLCAKKAKEESYMIPVQTGDSVTGVSLKVIRGKADKGLVDIFFRGALMGKVAAAFEAKEDRISGVIATSDEQTRQILSDNLPMFAESLNNNGKESVDLRVVYIPELSMETFEASSLQKEISIEKDETSNKENQVQTSRLYHVAEGFIQTITEIFN